LEGIEGKFHLMKIEERTTRIQTAIRYKRNTHEPRRSTKRRNILVGVCLFLVALTLALSFLGTPALNGRYHQDLALAHTGAQDLQVATALMQTLTHTPFDTAVAADARQHFTSALTIFTRLNNDIALVPDVLTSAPGYGGRLHAAKHLVPLAMEVAQAGLAACTILSTITARFHDSAGQALGLNVSDLAVLNNNLQQIKSILNLAIQQVNQLQPQDLQVDPRLGKMVSEFHSRLPLIQQGIDQASAFFSVAPMVLGIGSPANYLVEILDSSELRPGGGFVGNYGIVTLSGGRLASAHVTDTYLLDQGYGQKYHIDFPTQYSWFLTLSHKWGLRDSNLDADFPTSARNGAMLYKIEGGTLPLAGVVAITPELVERILTLTGPIAVPEYHETVTAQNLIALIHYHQLIEEGQSSVMTSPDGVSSLRKHFTALLGENLMARVHSLSGSMLPKMLQVLMDSIHTKDMQIYFNSDTAEKTLQSYHVDDAIQSPAGDAVFVVDANITPNKANRYLVTTVNDQVSIDNAGTATHHALIHYTWTTPGLTATDFYGSTHYVDYVRVHVPSNSVLLAQSGWNPKDSGSIHGRMFWGGYSSIDYPNNRTIALTWRVAGAAQKNAHGWHYQYLLQRQTGALQNMNLQVTLPSCATIVATSTGMVEDSKQAVHLTQALTQDTEASIHYTC